MFVQEYVFRLSMVRRFIIFFVIYNSKITICYNSDRIEICFTHFSVLCMISISFL